MLVEHSFVVVAPEMAARARAEGLLQQMGFRPLADEVGWLNMWRKLRNRAAGPHELPIRVRMDFDRQRIGVAISSDAERRSFTLSSGGGSKASGKLLLAIASSLEGVLAQGQTDEEALAAWRALEKKMAFWALLRRIFGWTLVSILLAFLALVMVGVIVAAVRG